MVSDKKSEMSFEEGMKKLEDIVRQLEEGAGSLENSLKLFEEGVKITKFCNEKLDEAEKKLEVLMKKGKKVVREEVREEEFFDSTSGEESE